MASILTPEDVVRRIAAECTFIDERGAVGIRPKPAAAIVRQYGEQFRRAPPAKAKPPTKSAPAPLTPPLVREPTRPALRATDAVLPRPEALDLPPGRRTRRRQSRAWS